MNDYDTLQGKIEALEASISASREEYSARIQALSQELKLLREQSDPATATSESQPVLQPVSQEPITGPVKTAATDMQAVSQHKISSQDIAASAIQSVAASMAAESDSETSGQPRVEAIDDKKAASRPARSTAQVESRPEPRPESRPESRPEPSFMNSLISNAFETFLAYILSSLAIFAAPAQDLYTRLIKLYYHYQKQGKAPVFLMTVAGLITLTVGFGYLLQYSFTMLFSDTLKAATGFFIGVAIIGLGVLLSKKKTDFRDYGASVIALGIIFNYMTAYFIGPYYNIVGETTGLLLLLGVTLAAFSLALIYETRVVSAITLIGGVFMPFVVGEAQSAGLVFLAYLFVLSMGNLYLSWRIKWPALAQITFFLSLSVIEFTGISDAVYPVAAVVLLSGFFYAYTWFWSFNGFQLKEALSKQDLTILVANAFYFIYVVMQLQMGDYLIAGTFLLHAMVLVVLMKALKLIKSVAGPLYMLITGLLIATAVFVLAPADITSIIWAIEGLAMLYIGFKYTHKLIRSEGYVIYIVAMSSLAWQSLLAFDAAAYTDIPWHWINLLAFGVLSFAGYRIICYFKDEASAIELKAAFVQNELFSFWGAISLSAIIIWNTSYAMAILAIIPVTWCFYRAARHQLKFAQITGYFLTLAFIAQIIFGIFDASSAAISQQTVYTWIALLELFGFIWGMRFYYQIFELSGRTRTLAFKLHNVYFYMPLMLVLSALYRVFDENVFGGYPLEFGYLWFDFILVAGLIASSYLLINKTQKFDESASFAHYRYVLNETVSLLASVIFLYTVAILFAEWMYNAAMLPLLYLLHRGLKQKLPLTELFAWLHFVFFAVMTMISYKLVGNLHFSSQPLATMMGWVQMLLSAWALQSVYDHNDCKKRGYQLARYVRIGVYLLIPLLFLPRVLRLYEDYFSVALWGSFTISWLMYRKLQVTALLKQLSVLFIIAIFSTVAMSMSALSGGSELAGLISLCTGVLIASVFHYIEKTLLCENIKKSPYFLLQLISPYFYGFAIAGFSYALLHQIAVVPVIIGLYFVYLLQARRLFNVVRESLHISYVLSWLGLLCVPLLVLYQVFSSTGDMSTVMILIAANLVSIVGLWYLTHQRIAVLRLFTGKYTSRNVQYWIFHCLLAAVYTGSLNLIFTDWSVGTSIALLIHAVMVLFLTLSDRYKGLLRLSIALYTITAVKVIFHDMDDFENIHRVIALMCIGSILMAAAYVFQKLRNKQIS